MTLRAAPLIAAVLVLAACSAPAPAPSASSVAEEPASTSATASPVQAAVLGTALTVTEGGSTAVYTVANLRPVPVEAQIIPAKGAMYSVDVTIAAQAGTTVYNGFYFVARSQDGSSIAPAVGAVKPGINSGQLGQGQNIDGHVAFDVPPGKSITQVALRDAKGATLAVWGVG
ncbi:MAG: DUF1942 domain-containing protein [Mycobacterium sp.]